MSVQDESLKAMLRPKLFRSPRRRPPADTGGSDMRPKIFDIILAVPSRRAGQLCCPVSCSPTLLRLCLRFGGGVVCASQNSRGSWLCHDRSAVAACPTGKVAALFALFVATPQRGRDLVASARSGEPDRTAIGAKPFGVPKSMVVSCCGIGLFALLRFGRRGLGTRDRRQPPNLLTCVLRRY